MGRRRSGFAVPGPPVGTEPLADFLDFSTSNLERLRSIIRWNDGAIQWPRKRGAASTISIRPFQSCRTGASLRTLPDVPGTRRPISASASSKAGEVCVSELAELEDE